MRLRSLDAADRRAYLRELRPRFLALRVRAGRIALRGVVPAAAIEEPLRAALRVAAVSARVRSWARVRLAEPAGVGAAAAAAVPRRATPFADRSTVAADVRDLADLLARPHHDLLSLPDGVPLLDVRARGAHVEIREFRLPAERKEHHGEP